MLREEVIAKLNSVLVQYPVKRAALFGSYARGEYTAESDVDIVVAFHTDSPGLMFFSLWTDLNEAIGLPIDLVSESGLNRMESNFQTNLRREEIVIYEAGVE